MHASLTSFQCMPWFSMCMHTSMQVLDYQRELAAKIAYLRMVTPKRPSDTRTGESSSGNGTIYVLREGKLVQSSGESRGSRQVALACQLHRPRPKPYLGLIEAFTPAPPTEWPMAQ